MGLPTTPYQALVPAPAQPPREPKSRKRGSAAERPDDDSPPRSVARDISPITIATAPAQHVPDMPALSFFTVGENFQTVPFATFINGIGLVGSEAVFGSTEYKINSLIAKNFRTFAHLVNTQLETEVSPPPLYSLHALRP